MGSDGAGRRLGGAMRRQARLNAAEPLGHRAAPRRVFQVLDRNARQSLRSRVGLHELRNDLLPGYQVYQSLEWCANENVPEAPAQRGDLVDDRERRTYESRLEG